MSEQQKGKPRGRAFPKGVSGNPGGRPKGFAAQIQKYCGKDYTKIAQAFALIAFGTAEQRKTFFGEPVKVTAKDRLVATENLRDSGPGKPSQAMQFTDQEGKPAKLFEVIVQQGTPSA